MEFTGKVIYVGEPKSGVSKTGKEWTSVSIVVENNEEKFTQSAVFDLFNQQMNCQVGDQVQVSFDFRAREWNGKWFNSLSAFKVEKLNDLFHQPDNPATPMDTAKHTPAQQEDQLPF